MSSTDSTPTSADLDEAIDRLALDLCTMRNPEVMAQTARALEGLMRYREERERRESSSKGPTT